MSILIFVFIFGSDLAARGWPTELIVKCILLSGIVIIALGWVDYLQWLQKLWQAYPRLDLIYRLPSENLGAMFYNLFILLAMARLLETRAWFVRILLGVYILSCLWLLFLTSSRGGWLGTAGGVICLLVIYISNGKLNWKPTWQKLRVRPIILIGLFIVVIAVAGVAGYFLYKETLHPTHGPILISRTEYWLPAWQGFLKSPIFGQGAFTYANAFNASHSVPPDVVFISAQGTFFNMLDERGITGLLAATWLSIALVIALWQKLSKAKDLSFSAIAGVVAALTALVLHSIFDGFFTAPLGLWFLAIVAGAVLGTASIGPQPFLFKRPFWVLLIIAAVWINLWAIYPLYQGVAQANNGQWSKAAQTFQASIQHDPGSVIAHQQLGLSESVLAENGDKVALDQAISSLSTTTRMEPSWAMNYANLGALYFNKKDLPSAQDAFEKSVKAAPRCSICYLNLGIVAETRNELSTAKTAYDHVFSLQPDWINAYFWRSTDFRKEIHLNWLNDHPLANTPTLQQLLAEKSSQSAFSVWYAQLAEDDLTLGNTQEAEKLLKVADLAYFSTPADHSEVRWVEAELAASQGKINDAVAIGQDAITSYQMQGGLGPGSFGQLYYGPYMFRRPAMAMELVPQLQTITTPDLWGQRMAQLMSWYQILGDTDHTNQLKNELIAQIPDFKEK
ncbi:MAG TPA: O-antigen ligase family protein [Anaerolineaceae bacterium]|nr:O-antigen ligase family protein [Anaerolineaceae bacterium]